MNSDSYLFFENQKANKRRWIENLILLNFIILVFFTLFGTGLPFQERTLDSFESEGTNIVNQIVYTSLFLFSLPIIFSFYNRLIDFILKEKFLSIFLIWCVISFLWSDYSFLSIKRSFQLVVMFIVILNSLLFCDFKKLLKSLKIIIVAYLIVTYVSGIFIPGAIDSSFGTWRGLESHKNGLGQMANILFLFSLLFYDKNHKQSTKIINYFISIFSIILVLLSGSSTAVMGFVVVVFLSIIFSFEKVFLSLRLGRTIFVLLILFIICSAIIVSFSKDLLAFIPGLFDKDLTLTGRTDIWAYVWDEIQKKPLLGYGYSTYWVKGTSRIETFQIIQSHNSYLEITLQVGILGFLLFFILCVSFFKRIFNKNDNLAFLALLTILILNFTEGSLFQTRGRSTFIFMFFYILVSSFFFELKRPFKNILK